MKKLLAFALAAVLVFSLAACQPTTPTNAPNNPTNAPSNPTTAPDKPTTAPDKPTDAPQPAEPGKVVIGVPNNVNVVDWETNDFTLLLEEKCNVDISFKVYSDDRSEAATQLALEISGGETLPGILWNFRGIDTATMFEYGEDGYFLDLREYLEDPEKMPNLWGRVKSQLDESSWTNMFELFRDPTNGALYFAPSVEVSSTDRISFHTYINKDWLAKLGMEAPTTVDDLYKVLVAFRDKDPNGNGLQDEIPSISYNTKSYGYRCSFDQFIINAWVYCNDNYLFNATNGKIWLPYNTNEYRQAMIYLNKLHKEGLFSDSSYNFTAYSEMKEIWTPAEGPSIAGIVGCHRTLGADAANPITNEYTGMGPLKGETSLGGYANWYDNSYRAYTFVTEDCEDLDAAMRVLDFMYSLEGAKSMRYGREGVNWDNDIPEGSTNSLGVPATFKYWDDQWSKLANNTWHSIECTVVYTSDMISAWTNTDTESVAYKNTINFQDYWKLWTAGKVPEEVVYGLAYTAEETEAIGTLISPYRDYVRTARAEFLTGQKDPNNDADWNTYLQNLKALGEEELIKHSQTAYTRLKGN